MANVAVSSHTEARALLPRLEAGDHLDQKTFHQRYEAMPSDFRAELIGGFVVVPSPLSGKHGRYHARVMYWLGEYEAHTPGTEVYDNPTVILGPESEPQPDAVVVVKPECGGRTEVSEDGYIAGPPELVVEVASSSEAYDLYEKSRDYEKAGVREYVVVMIRDGQVRWFCLEGGQYQPLSPGADGVYRSGVFPGVRLDPTALLALDSGKLMETLREGLAGEDHAAFVEKLRAGRGAG